MARQMPPSKQHRQYSFSGLTRLTAPVPPMLEKALGYTGAARLVAFYWIPGGDEAYYNDGRSSGTGNWQGFLAYVQHPVVNSLLRDYDLGSSDSDAKHYLILDRDERKLYAATVKDAETFLRQQWPKTEPIRMSKEEWSAIVTQAIKNVQANRKDIDVDEIQRRIEEQYVLVEALQHWLNRFLPN